MECISSPGLVAFLRIHCELQMPGTEELAKSIKAPQRGIPNGSFCKKLPPQICEGTIGMEYRYTVWKSLSLDFFLCPVWWWWACLGNKHFVAFVLPCAGQDIWLPMSLTELIPLPFSSQVLFLICRKLIGHQIVNGTEVLKWLREILICRNKFLMKNKVWFHYYEYIHVNVDQHWTLLMA